jgi:transcriptional regulator with XRE-family HTH domain
MNRDETTFPERLKQLLKDKDETAANLARVIEVSPQAVGKWLRGGDINFDTLRKVANYLNVNWVWLRYGPAALEELQKENEKSGSLDFLRKEYLTSVMENERRHSKLFQTFDIGVWEENPITGIGFWSPIARRLLGALPDMQATHDNFRNLLLKEDQPVVDKLHSSILLGSENRAISQIRASAFPTTILDIHTVVERDEMDRPINMLGIIRRSGPS